MDRQFLIEALDYNPETGLFTWKARPRHHFNCDRGMWQWNGKYPGTPAGTKQKPNKNYDYERIKIHILGRTYPAHRVAWIITYGDIPDGMYIDHIDGDPKNNSISNLRLVTHSQNHRNRSMPPSNTSGAVGVRQANGKWTARVKILGKEIYLGRFETFEQAVEARRKASQENGFTEKHHV
jgi:HNH endonuclease